MFNIESQMIKSVGTSDRKQKLEWLAATCHRQNLAILPNLIRAGREP